MTRKSIFRFAWAVTIVFALTLGCKIVDDIGNGVNQAVTVATQIQGAATSVDIGGISTQMGGLVTQIDIGGITTQMGGLVTQIDIGGITTDIGGITTEIGSLSTDLGDIGIPGLDETAGPVNTPTGFPSDIPLMTGDKTDMSGTPTQLTYSVDADINAVVDFYKAEMNKLHWTEQPGSTGDGDTTLVFQNGNRKATVHITEDFLSGVQVQITLGS